MGRFLLASMAVVLALTLSACASSPALQEKPPMPENVAIQPPGDSVPKEFRGFSGMWEGEWITPGGRYNGALFVESLGTYSAVVIYSQTGGRSGPYRVRANMDDGGWLRFQLPYGASQEYKLEPDGTISATNTFLGFSGHAKFKRVALK